MALLALRDIHKSYGALPVLAGLNLTAEPGRFHALVGRNGSGKSTLMRIAMRLEPPDSGDGEVLGRSILVDSSRVNHEVAYVSELLTYPAYYRLSTFFKQYARIMPGWDLELFHSILKPIGFDLEKTFPSLSRGQRMQLATAAALALRPKLLLLDEITAVFDARARAYFMDLLARAVREGSSVILATNIVSEVHSFADHLLYLDRGRIEIDSPIAELATRFVKLRRAANDSHAVFSAPSCVAVGLDDDGAPLFLLPRESPSVPETLLSARPVRAEELFVYFSTRDRES